MNTNKQSKTILIAQYFIYSFNSEALSILDQAKSQNNREFLKIWHSDK